MAGRRDAGETLIELAVSIMIMGITVAVLLGALATSIRLSGVHREQAVTRAYLQDFAAKVAQLVDARPTGYQSCAGAATYEAAYTVPNPARYERRVVEVRYWNGTAFAAGCTTDLGVQQLRLRVRTLDDAAAELLDIVVRRPCRPTAESPLDPPCA